MPFASFIVSKSGKASVPFLDRDESVAPEDRLNYRLISPLGASVDAGVAAVVAPQPPE